MTDNTPTPQEDAERVHFLQPRAYSFNHRTRLVDPIEETREIASCYEQRFHIFRSIACAISVSFDSIGRHPTSTLSTPETA